jgi:hypothetical protein
MAAFRASLHKLLSTNQDQSIMELLSEQGVEIRLSDAEICGSSFATLHDHFVAYFLTLIEAT